MLRLTPIVDVWPREIAPGWAPAIAEGRLIELGERTPDADIIVLVAELAAYNQIEALETLGSAVDALLAADELIAPGGFQIEAEGFACRPGCCAGLESWREWIGLAPGATSPFLGHDPAPFVDCQAAGARIWADGGLDKPSSHTPSVFVPYNELHAAIDAAAAALAGFQRRLDAWCGANLPGAQARFAARFAREFSTLPSSAF